MIFFIHGHLLTFRNLISQCFVTSDLNKSINQCFINISIYINLLASKALAEAQMKMKR